MTKTKNKSEKQVRKPPSRAELIAVYEKFKHKCAICGKRTPLDRGEIDHKKSLKKGGADKYSNFQWLCARCNRFKSSNKTNRDVKVMLGLNKQKKKKPVKKKIKKKATKVKPKKKTKPKTKKKTKAKKTPQYTKSVFVSEHKKKTKKQEKEEIKKMKKKYPFLRV